LEIQNAHDTFQTWDLEVVDGSAITPNNENEMTDYNEKATKTFALFCEHLTNAQLAHIQYCENVKNTWETLCGLHETKTIKDKFFRRRFFTIEMQEGENLFAHINIVKIFATDYIPLR
jgi:hypothetical protein